MPKCKGCGKEIIWIKQIPCDPLPVAYWAKEKARGKVVTPNGQVISCDFRGDLQRATGLGYVTHFASCPAAARFRKVRG